MEYAVQMGSGAMIYIPSFIKIGFGIQKLIGGDAQTRRQKGDVINLLFIYFQSKEYGLKMMWCDVCDFWMPLVSSAVMDSVCWTGPNAQIQYSLSSSTCIPFRIPLQ
jgi:hypothetical protein